MKMHYALLPGLLFWLRVATAQTPGSHWSEVDKQIVMTALETSRQELLAAVKPLTEKQFFFRPDAKTWSPNDIVEHLGLIEEGYIREFWWALAQPPMPASYRDSTAGGDQRANAYATAPQKSEARGTNLPHNRFCSKETCLNIFTIARDQSVEFFIKNGGLDMRGYYVFRKGGSGRRDIRDLHQQALWMIAHTVRHTNQLKQVVADPGFLKADTGK